MVFCKRQSSNEALQRFASIASHDLREPLRQVPIFTQLLARKHRDADAQSQQYFDFVETGAARMGQLLDGLMTYTQMNASHLMPLQTVDIKVALEEAQQGLQLALQEADAIVTHDPLPRVAGNHSQLAELLQSLISNALKYRSAEAPRIHVSAKRCGPEWVVCVSDSGIALRRESREDFQAFMRLHRQKIAGVGLGLAFCAEIAELHKGRIWVERNQLSPSGSIFSFALPV